MTAASTAGGRTLRSARVTPIVAVAVLLAAAPALAGTVRVSSTEALRTALDEAASDPGRIIEIEPGTYRFHGYSLATLGSPQKGGRPIRGLTVRGLGASPRDVVLQGTGMDATAEKRSRFGFVLFDATDVAFENFTIRDVRGHLFHMKGERGADRITFRRLRLINSGSQFIKGTANRWVDGVDDGLVEDCHFEYEVRQFAGLGPSRAEPRLLERVGEKEARVQLAAARPGRPFTEDYWKGATASAAGHAWTARVVASRVAEGATTEQFLTFDVPVPADLPRTLSLVLDRTGQGEPAWGPPGGYTNAIDIHTGRNWVIRRSTFVRIGTNLQSRYQHAVASVLLWNGSENALVERVAFLDCESGVMLGLGQKTGAGKAHQHRGGVVKHAWFYRSKGVKGDRAFGFESSPDARIEDAHVVLNGSYPNAVEYRFATTTGFVARGVRADATVANRIAPPPAEAAGALAADPEDVLRVVRAAIEGSPVPGQDTDLATRPRTSPAPAAVGSPTTPAAAAEPAGDTPKREREP
jgi:hypothetical protein